MNYVETSNYELTVNRIVPVPKQVEELAGGLKLTRTSKFNLTAPEAVFGPVMTAGQRIRKLLSDH